MQSYYVDGGLNRTQFKTRRNNENIALSYTYNLTISTLCPSAKSSETSQTSISTDWLPAIEILKKMDFSLLRALCKRHIILNRPNLGHPPKPVRRVFLLRYTLYSMPKSLISICSVLLYPILCDTGSIVAIVSAVRRYIWLNLLAAVICTCYPARQHRNMQYRDS